MATTMDTEEDTVEGAASADKTTTETMDITTILDSSIEHQCAYFTNKYVYC